MKAALGVCREDDVVAVAQHVVRVELFRRENERPQRYAGTSRWSHRLRDNDEQLCVLVIARSEATAAFVDGESSEKPAT